MHRNLIANAPFSPSIANSIGFYIGRLKKEEFTRRLGLVFVILTVLLQSFAIISPPEPTIASGPNNIIYSGITSVEDLLNKYDNDDDGNNHQDIQQIFNHYGISRDDIARGSVTTIQSTDKDRRLRSIGRIAYGKEGEIKVPIPGTTTAVYERYLWSWDNRSPSSYKVIQGETTDGRWFAILMSCGNLVVDQPPPAPLSPLGFVEHNCSAISGWAYDPNQADLPIKVGLVIRLEDNKNDYDYIETTANLPGSPESISGNHGFSFSVPDIWKSNTLKTVYTLVAFDGAGGGDDVDLANNRSIETPCATPEPRSCEYNQSLSSTDSRCKECSYRSGLWSEDPTCQSLIADTAPVSCRYNNNLTSEDVLCVPCPLNGNLWINDEGCREQFSLLVYSKNAKNITQNIANANNTMAQPGDIIEYELIVENIGNISESVVIEENLSDILEYSSVRHSDSGQFDDVTETIGWGDETVEPNSRIIKTIQIQIDNSISSAPTPLNNLESNNLELRNVFHGKSVVIKVPRPLNKTPEVLSAALPNTGSGSNIIFGFLLLSITAYFYARNRQLSNELKLVKKELAQGVM